MWRRGANLEGDTANFIETEQLLEFEGFRSSFLQIRGSIPLLWEQIVDLSYKPRLNIINHEETPKVMERHFHDLVKRYGDVTAVDLTNKHGDEGLLSAAYATEIQKLSSVRYVSFDFHHHCGGSNFDNIQLLYDQISEDFEKKGYFLIDTEEKILLEQRGVVRSNCIDCLDRTNVTQSYLARKSLDSQLQRLGALSSNESISMFTEDFEIFKTSMNCVTFVVRDGNGAVRSSYTYNIAVWVDQGDEISLEYSGTHALKRDLVRYGKQTMTGLIQDGMSAVSRYFLNNFQDGIRQACCRFNLTMKLFSLIYSLFDASEISICFPCTCRMRWTLQVAAIMLTGAAPLLSRNMDLTHSVIVVGQRTYCDVPIADLRQAGHFVGDGEKGILHVLSGCKTLKELDIRNCSFVQQVRLLGARKALMQEMPSRDVENH
ncbi:Phosphoinositide phosphatase SAC8 [Capsicum annuum]|uniref:Phosphoinositide phosphatase SAC8 n=1 Tax=Capsicum annuum TaxID=4072 RepID=A0A2G2YL87_CAPAN|nr:Phosphoinositide phosphatase SAC8 [Capsicum annuum]KAF3674536.1 Phosphoinositide phosphatase SAC8 [Capsicum annuum]PHT70510.1 Phosphoinositide phosphatase SAC8 [Capsicum annuum]